MTEAKQVEEALSSAFVQVNAGMAIDEALMNLQAAQAQYGVVIGSQDRVLGLVTIERLREGDANAYVETLIDSGPPIFLEPNVTLDTAVRALAKDFVLRPQLAGVVVQAQGKVEGILPRNIIVERAARLGTRGVADRLTGSPLDILFFECPVDHERRIVVYYDPSNPPKCSQGHLMMPIEE